MIPLRHFFRLCTVLFLCHGAFAQTSKVVSPGWNLLGNGNSSALNVADPSLFGSVQNVTSVWKWIPSKGNWAFYTPSMTNQELSNYAQGQGFDVLSTINAGEGFWVHAKSPFTVLLANSSPMSATALQSSLQRGWNLVAVGETKNASDFDVTSLWAWDSTRKSWYFYALNPDADGSLSASIQSSGYFDFTSSSQRLEPGMGFWVNVPDTTTHAPPTKIAVSQYEPRTVGLQSIASSTKLSVAWDAPAYAVDHYLVTATESLQNSRVAVVSKSSPVVLSTLRAETSYNIVVTACKNASCSEVGRSAPVSGTTAKEYWQLQGSGNSVSGLTPPVVNGNARLSATRFGAEAGINANTVQFYYGALGVTGQGVAVSGTVSASNPASYLSGFTSYASTSGLRSPTPTATSGIKSIMTGQGVPLSSAMGAKVRLFFESNDADGKTRIYYVDSVDGYIGRDFNSGAATTCTTSSDYVSGGNCAATVVVGANGDAVNPTSKVNAARQNKVGWPTLTDWRWDGAIGTFMVYTFENVAGCTTATHNHAYAVWNGSAFVTQFASNGCPKMFAAAQAAVPMHIGGVRYKMYYADPTITAGKLARTPGRADLPFTGPKKLIYADGRRSSDTSVVDYEDWEGVGVARNIVFLWPNGDLLSDTAEGYIDDFQFLTPTGDVALQVLYLTITDGTVTPVSATAVLLNP